MGRKFIIEIDADDFSDDVCDLLVTLSSNHKLNNYTTFSLENTIRAFIRSQTQTSDEQSGVVQTTPDLTSETILTKLTAIEEMLHNVNSAPMILNTAEPKLMTQQVKPNTEPPKEIKIENVGSKSSEDKKNKLAKLKKLRGG